MPTSKELQKRVEEAHKKTVELQKQADEMHRDALRRLQAGSKKRLRKQLKSRANKTRTRKLKKKQN